MRSVNEIETRVAGRIAKLRQRREMSQRQLGEAVGLHRMVINKIEAGHRSIKLGEAVAFSAVLGVELTALISPEPLMLHVDPVRVDEGFTP